MSHVKIIGVLAILVRIVDLLEKMVYQGILNTPEYASLVKRDWYGLDFLYLKHHKDNIFWTDFQHITDFPEYLSFFRKGQTFEQIQNITKFYQTSTIPEDHEFIYLTGAGVDEFIEETVQKIKERLNHKLRLQLV